MKKESWFSHLVPCIKKPYCCFCKHIKTYKYHYILGFFWSFAVIKAIVFFLSIVWILYHIPDHAAADISPSICMSTTDVPSSECEALIELYNSTDWEYRAVNTSRWVSPTVCSWYGIWCTLVEWTSHISTITLNNNNLSWTLPSTLTNLPFLENLSMTHNNLYGIWDIYEWSLPLLKSINLSYNHISDITPLTFLYSLITLNISHNSIDSLPPFTLWSKINRIHELDISYNLLDDTSREKLTMLSSLNYLNLDRNYFSTIPSTVSNFSNLQSFFIAKNKINNIWNVVYIPLLTTFDASYNSLSTLPNFSSKSPLQSLSVSFNSISTLFTTNSRWWIWPEIYLLPNLTTLIIDNNTITQIPDSISWSHLQHFDISYNKIKDSLERLTPLFSRLPLTSINLAGNFLTWEIPSSITTLTSLIPHQSDISYNQLETDGIYTPHDANILSFLNTYFTIPDRQKDWKTQYAYITVSSEIQIDNNQTYVAWSPITIPITITNTSNRDTSGLLIWLLVSWSLANSLLLDSSQYTWTLPFTIYPRREYGTNTWDICFNQLITANTWPYVTALNERVYNNFSGTYSSFFNYLTNKRDYIDRDEHTRWAMIAYGLSNYTKEWCYSEWFALCLKKLFTVDITRLWTEGCGTWDGTFFYASALAFPILPIPFQENHNIQLPFTIAPLYTTWTIDLFIGIQSSDYTKILTSSTLSSSTLHIIPPHLPICGNNILETWEECDWTNLNNKSCSTFWYTQWTLSCTTWCTFNTNNCSNPPLWGGGGGGWGWTPLIPDNCPEWDFTASAYDRMCWTPPTSPIHGVATSPQAQPDDTKEITRKDLALLLSPFIKQVVILPTNPRLSCTFSDTNYVTTSEYQAIMEVCQKWIMWFHENGIDQQTQFKPDALVTREMLYTTISRILYGNTYNIPLGVDPVWRYKKHVDAVAKIGIIWDIHKITQQTVIHLLDYIKNHPDLVQRTDLSHHATAPASSPTPSTPTNKPITTIIPTVITKPATRIGNTIKTFLEYLISVFTSTKEEKTEEQSHASASSVTKTSSPRTLLHDLKKFFP